MSAHWSTSVITPEALLSGSRRWTLRLILAVLACGAYPSVAEDWLHTVRPGDTFWSLCLELTNEPGCWQKLPQYNSQVRNPRALPQGSQIKIPVEWLKAPPAPASVELVRGEAKLIRQGSRKRIQPGQALDAGDTYLQTEADVEEIELRAGEILNMGDKIVTGEGNVLLRFADNSSFLIKSNSELLLERLSAHQQTGMVDTHMRLNYGSGRAKVNSRNGKTRYQISTPAAIAAARGTDFSVSAGPASTNGPAVLTNEVLEGTVAIVSTVGEQAVQEGYGTVAEANKAPLPPVKLLAAPDLNLDQTTELPFTLNWPDVSGAKGYNIDVYEGNGTSNLFKSVRSTNSNVDFPALTSNTYTFVVRAIDQLGLKGLEAIASTKATVQLATPNLLQERVLVNGTSVSISWPEVENATSYRVQVATDKQFENMVKEVETSEPAVSLELPEGQVYYSRIQAIYPHHGASAFSGTQKFSSKVRDLWLILLQAIGILAVVI